MRFQRIVGPVKGRVRRSRPTPKVGNIPEITTPSDPKTVREPAARPEKKPVPFSSYLVASLALSTLLFGFFLLGDRGLWELRRQRQRLAGLQTEVSALAAEDERLAEEVARLKNDPAAAEKVAREELNFVRPGEVVLLLPKGWMEQMGRAPEDGKKPPLMPPATAPAPGLLQGSAPGPATPPIPVPVAPIAP